MLNAQYFVAHTNTCTICFCRICLRIAIVMSDLHGPRNTFGSKIYNFKINGTNTRYNVNNGSFTNLYGNANM